MKNSYLTKLWVICLLSTLWQTLQAASLNLPDDPRQSIKYWKPYIIEPFQDARVALSHEIFQTLLRTWEGAKVAPDLYIVDSSAGPWAASLADGNILMSRAALDTAFAKGDQNATHLLAFILGHELAHQKVNDLWHQKFLRMAGNQAPTVRRQLIQDLKIDAQSLIEQEQREAQADHDGLLLMASVGYDPFAVVTGGDFFTHWVENIWSHSCQDKTAPAAMNRACQQAGARALRTRSQLQDLAAQASLFELGNQAYIAGQFNKAQHYFSVYGKDYPHRSVYINLGLSYLAPAISINEALSDKTGTNFHFPLILEPNPFAVPALSRHQGKRGDSDHQRRRLLKQRRQLVAKAITQFEKALRLDPNHRSSYQLLTIAYLLDENTAMARGILQGKYLQRFKPGAYSKILLALVNAGEGKSQQAIKQLKDLQQKLKLDSEGNIPQQLLSHTIARNLAMLAKDDKPELYWRGQAKVAQKTGNSVLFQLSLKQLSHNSTQRQFNDLGILGKFSLPPKEQLGQSHTLWLDGEKHFLIQGPRGQRYFTDDQYRVLSLWQEYHPEAQPVNSLRVGEPQERTYKLLGLPDRHVFLTAGQYLVYDQQQIAIKVLNGKVAGWFRFRS